MTDTSIRLNNKINNVNRRRKRGMKSLKANKIAGIDYVDTLPDISISTLALVFDKTTNKLFVNGGDMWYAIDRFEGTIPVANNYHFIFVQRKIIFYSLFYYNDEQKIYITELEDGPVFNRVFDRDIKIEKIDGYNLYTSYVEVG